LVDAAFAGRIVDAEKEFSKASVAGTNPTAIVGAALRQIDRLHAWRLDVESGTAASAVIERTRPQIHFRRKPMVETALKAWTSERLTKAMAMLAEASLDVRRQSGLAETIAQRAMMLIARAAAQRN
jgi:DNA polymerase III subunit delta